ncbi:hypothetical protein CEQ51_28345 [Pseudomonas thivervalensis]|uniref:Uncharacterized protein n=1 Tax=Pseudomonas thivervalensis TaxID=86265 RepID=A0A176NK51_9PSED|nr:hypothetical protein CE140_28350 [Pseudomonas thivervalensis]AXA63819.1 hypothetical protein CEQ51_28345 [Pseudomonas thivervalensis]OAB51457.1 hypothetical protein APS14_27625 [Pseudomonas thivervalensis]
MAFHHGAAIPAAHFMTVESRIEPARGPSLVVRLVTRLVLVFGVPPFGFDPKIATRSKPDVGAF